MCDKRDGHRQTFTGAARYCRPTGFWQSVDAIYVCENHQSCDCYTIVFFSNQSPLDLSMNVN